jgi:hypothetical protein
MYKLTPQRLTAQLPHLPRLSLLLAWVIAVLLVVAWFGVFLLKSLRSPVRSRLCPLQKAASRNDLRLSACATQGQPFTVFYGDLAGNDRDSLP